MIYVYESIYYTENSEVYLTWNQFSSMNLRFALFMRELITTMSKFH